MSENEYSGVLVTGVNGFVGEHLVAELANNGHEVYGLGRELQGDINPLISDRLAAYWQVDMMDLSAFEAIEWDKITAVIHLAGYAAVGESFKKPDEYMDVNTGVMRNLFEAALAHDAFPRVISISTGAVYGSTDGATTEDTPLNPGSPYAKSKIAAEEILMEYREKGFSDSVNVRPFNHIGPHQKPGFLVPDMGYQIAQGKDPITAGNLESYRDYTDVRDVARAYRLLVEAKVLRHAVYNVCSGHTRQGQEMFELLRSAANKPNLRVVTTQDKLRNNDDDRVVGSHDRLTSETGWQLEVPIEQTVQDFYDSIAA